MKRVILGSVVSIITICSPVTYAWNCLGHKVIARIAYDHLSPTVKEKIDTLVNGMSQQYPNIHHFTDLACWPDQIRGQKIESYTHWHYIDVAFSLDGSPLKNLMDTDNAVWAVNKIIPVIQNKKANVYERTRFLAFFAHIVSDLHQPLHTVSLISNELPDGDKGGNEYHVIYQNKKQNLHALWDMGVGLFNGSHDNERADSLARQTMKSYPEAYFQNKSLALNPEAWVEEGVSNAKSSVYTIKYGATINDAYVQKAERLVAEESALAGYRLARLLNQLFQ